MKYLKHILCCVALCLTMQGIFCSVNGADPFVTNQKRIEEITRAILADIERQQKEFKEELNKAAKPNGMDPGMGPGMGPGVGPGMGPGMGPGKGGPETEAPAKKIERFKLDRDAIVEMLRKRYRYDLHKSAAAAASGSIDTRSEVEIREEIINEISMEARPQSELLAEDRAYCEKTYPLYKPGQNVDITFAVGNEPPKRYRGSFKRISPYRIQIGRNIVNLSDLPEIIRCRFDEKLNKKLKEDYMKRRPITTKYNLELQTEVAKRAKEVLEKQMTTNLNKGWVYINDAWKMPEDLVDDVLEFRKKAHKGQFMAPEFQKTWGLQGN